MSSQDVSVTTDPTSYTSKDLLLLTQLLHGESLINPEAVAKADLTEIGTRWFEHKSTNISRNLKEFPLSKPPSGTQVLKLYENMLADNEKCATTTDLANNYYFKRVAELEEKLTLEKGRFNQLLEGD